MLFVDTTIYSSTSSSQRLFSKTVCQLSNCSTNYPPAHTAPPFSVPPFVRYDNSVCPIWEFGISIPQCYVPSFRLHRTPTLKKKSCPPSLSASLLTSPPKCLSLTPPPNCFPFTLPTQIFPFTPLTLLLSGYPPYPAFSHTLRSGLHGWWTGKVCLRDCRVICE